MVKRVFNLNDCDVVCDLLTEFYPDFGEYCEIIKMYPSNQDQINLIVEKLVDKFDILIVRDVNIYQGFYKEEEIKK